MLQKLQILYYVNVFWFNIKLLKRVTDDFFYAKKVFLFLPFLNLGTQIRCPQNRYTDLKSALDQPLIYITMSTWYSSISLTLVLIDR